MYFYRYYGAIDIALLICFKRILNYNQNKKKIATCPKNTVSCKKPYLLIFVNKCETYVPEIFFYDTFVNEQLDPFIFSCKIKYSRETI